MECKDCEYSCGCIETCKLKSSECYQNKKGVKMTSVNKKHKARNSYLHNGGEKLDGKHKRLMYYTKRQRKQLKEQKNE